MKIDYPFKITTHNNLVLVDLPKTPDKYLGKGLLFTASNGIRVVSSYVQAFYSSECVIHIRGSDDNQKTGTMAISQLKIGYTLTPKQAEEFKDKLKAALDEFVAWMIKQEEPVTKLDVFLELFPDADLNENGYPEVCPQNICGRVVCGSDIQCLNCERNFWSQPAPDKFQKKEDQHVTRFDDSGK